MPASRLVPPPHAAHARPAGDVYDELTEERSVVQGGHVHRSIKPHSHHLCYAARIVAVCLVDLRLQHGAHVSRLNTDHWQAHFGENAVKPLRQRSSFQPNSLEAIDGGRHHLQEGFPRFPHDLARIIHNADARFESITNIASERRSANIVRDHAMVLPDDATPKPD